MHSIHYQSLSHMYMYIQCTSFTALTVWNVGVNFTAPDAIPVVVSLEWSGDTAGVREERDGAENLREASLEEVEGGRREEEVEGGRREEEVEGGRREEEVEGGRREEEGGSRAVNCPWLLADDVISDL